MDRLAQKKHSAIRRANRVRSLTSRHVSRPRLSVYISNMHVSAQIIDDSKAQTLAYVTTVGQKTVADLNMTQKAQWVGEQIALKSKKAKVSKVVFDRGAKLYHGRVKVLAEAARKNGLEF